MFLKSQLLETISGIDHGFGTKGEPIPGLSLDWKENHPRLSQVHGEASVEVISPGQECGRCDALYSFMRDVPLGIRTGDCVPVLIAHRNGKWVTGIHAGWRGTRARIVQKVLREILKHPKAKGDQPSDCVAAIGPAIGPCCYQVSAELEKDFKSEFSQAGKYFQSLPNRCLDLPALNEWQLKEAGVQEVDLIRACTFCSQSSNSSESAFHSYRRNANTDRQWSVILKR